MNSEIKSTEVRTDEQPAAADEGYRLVKVKAELITFLEQLGHMHRFFDFYRGESIAINGFDPNGQAAEIKHIRWRSVT